MSSYYERERYHYGRDYYTLSSRYLGASDRDWRIGKNSGRRIIQHDKKSKSRVCLIIALVIIVLLIVLSIVLIVVYNNRSIPDPEVIECPPGLSGEYCDSTQFIGTLVWSGDTLYTLSDGLLYKKGIAFRVYAPSALRVMVLVSVPGGAEQEYPMA